MDAGFQELKQMLRSDFDPSDPFSVLVVSEIWTWMEEVRQAHSH